jgi:hypothetical protein
MKPLEVKKKVEKIKRLLGEYGTLSATVKQIEKDIKESGAMGLDMPVGEYLNNMKRRINTIEEAFDNLLK